MVVNETNEISLLVNDEKDLYTPFNPEPEFNPGVQGYIRSKIAGQKYSTNLKLRVLSSAPLDEDRFRSAVENWMREEEAVMRKDYKTERHMLIGLLVIASLFIIISLALAEHINVLSYTIIPVLGSVALVKAAGICIIQLPINNAKLKLLEKIKENNLIEFEQIESK